MDTLGPIISALIIKVPSFSKLLYSLKFSRMKIFEGFEDFCLALKTLLTKIVFLQRHLLKLISSLDGLRLRYSSNEYSKHALFMAGKP